MLSGPCQSISATYRQLSLVYGRFPLPVSYHCSVKPIPRYKTSLSYAPVLEIISSLLGFAVSSRLFMLDTDKSRQLGLLNIRKKSPMQLRSEIPGYIGFFRHYYVVGFIMKNKTVLSFGKNIMI